MQTAPRGAIFVLAHSIRRRSRGSARSALASASSMLSSSHATALLIVENIRLRAALDLCWQALEAVIDDADFTGDPLIEQALAACKQLLLQQQPEGNQP